MANDKPEQPARPDATPEPDAPGSATPSEGFGEQPTAADGAPEATAASPEGALPVATPATGSAAGRARRFAGHRATQIVAAGVVGLLLGGAAVALADGVTDRRDYPRHAAFEVPGDGRLEPHVWRGGGAAWFDHRHDEDGSVIPGEPGRPG